VYGGCRFALSQYGRCIIRPIRYLPNELWRQTLPLLAGVFLLLTIYDFCTAKLILFFSPTVLLAALCCSGFERRVGVFFHESTRSCLLGGFNGSEMAGSRPQTKRFVEHQKRGTSNKIDAELLPALLGAVEKKAVPLSRDRINEPMRRLKSRYRAGLPKRLLTDELDL